jgi:hypothetical protein
MQFFKLFLLCHKNSLEKLLLKQDKNVLEVKLLHEEIFYSLKEFSKLKSLSLINFTMPNSQFLTVKILTIQKASKMNIEEICLNFPNIETLNVYSQKALKADLKSMKNLKSLFIESSKILLLKYHRLNRIILSDMQLQFEIFENNNFLEIFIDNCEELQHLISFLKLPETKLNLLNIESCQINKSQMDFIKSLSGSKIKHLIIIHCNENVNDVELKKLKTN